MAAFRRTVVAGFALAGAAACSDSFNPPSGALAFQIPAPYLEAWQRVQACSGLYGQFERIQWYVVPGSDVLSYADRRVNGFFHPPRSIFLSERAAYDSIGDYFTVRHEMLHYLLDGESGHPPIFSQCGLLRL